MPFVIFIPNTFLVTDWRVPSEALIAFSSTCAVWAAYAVYGCTTETPYLALNASMKVLPAPTSLSAGTPAFVTYIPSPAAPAEPCPVSVELRKNPSGAISLTPVFGPSTATLSLISWPPFEQISPPRKIASGLVALIFVISAW